MAYSAILKPEVVHHSSTSLYISHLMATWFERMWEFALPLFLSDLLQGNLLIVATYNFSLSLLTVLLGRSVGTMIDRMPRIKVLALLLLCQNIFIAGNALILWWLMNDLDGVADDYGIVQIEKQEHLFVPLIVCVHIFGAFAALAFQGSKIAIERDWIICMSRGDKTWLAKQNSRLKSIDLLCKVLAPCVAGIIMTYVAVDMVALLVGFGNLIAVFVEYWAMYVIYKKYPELAIKNMKQTKVNDEKVEIPPEVENDLEKLNEMWSDLDDDERDRLWDHKMNLERQALEKSKSDLKRKRKLKKKQKNQKKQQKYGNAAVITESTPFAHLPDDDIDESFDVPIHSFDENDQNQNNKRKSSWWNDLGVYRAQRSFYALLSFAFIFLTVLSFGPIMIAYLKYRGLNEATIAYSRSLGPLFGLIGTLLYPICVKRFGLVLSGLYSLWFLVICILITVSSFFVENPIISLTMMIGGVVTSRLGLWIYDIAIAQISQEMIIEQERGVVNGLQTSFQSAASLIAYALVIVFASPDDFFIPSSVSAAAIFLAGIFYTQFAYVETGGEADQCFYTFCCVGCCNCCNSNENNKKDYSKLGTDEYSINADQNIVNNNIGNNDNLYQYSDIDKLNHNTDKSPNQNNEKTVMFPNIVRTESVGGDFQSNNQPRFHILKEGELEDDTKLESIIETDDWNDSPLNLQGMKVEDILSKFKKKISLDDGYSV